jgi:hypothetical protein
MSEPSTQADTVEEVVPGILHWRLDDDRLGGHVSAAHAVETAGGAVLVDPLPLAPEAFEQIGRVCAIVLTTSSHQRSSWRLRRELGVPVYAPALAREVEEEPDERYGDRDALPGGLHAVFTPGAGTTQHTLLLDERVAFVPDLLTNAAGEGLRVTPDHYLHDPAEARRSLERLLDSEAFDVLCLAHGEPVRERAKARIAEALSR